MNDYIDVIFNDKYSIFSTIRKLLLNTFVLLHNWSGESEV